MSNVFKYSDEQLEVINAPVGDILVSAAAGSGKTTVLVERIIRKIISGEDYGVDKILVMTFTREAANNMNDKIATAIQKKIDELSADYANNKNLIARLRQQRDALPNSYIQTIDSFCTRVIKEKSYVCADSEEAKLIEPGNTILDNNELDLILYESADTAINETYKDQDFEAFEKLTHLFGNGRTDAKLVETVISVYKKLRSIPSYIERCDSIIRRREEADNTGELLGLDQILDRLMDIYRMVNQELATNLLGQIKDITFLASKNEERQNWFMDLVEEMTSYATKVVEAYDSGVAPLSVLELIKSGANKVGETLGSFNGYPAIKSDDKLKNAEDEINRDRLIKLKEDIAPIFTLVILLKKQLGIDRSPSGYNDATDSYMPGKEYSSIIDGDIDTYLELQKNRTNLSKAFVDLIKKTDKLYAENKARVHGMDFADQEHLACKILENKEAQEFYKEKFTEIYIDEYQDNSELQDSIIKLIKREEGNVFRVGDVKQSIYKFRYAKPKMFLDIAEEYANDKDKGTLFLLNQNHRSSGEILDFCNSLFEQLMSRKATEISYDDTQKLKYSEDKKCGVVPRVIVVNNHGRKKSSVDSSGEVKESNFGFKAIADEINRYLDSGFKKDDICILTRRRITAARLSNYLNDIGLDTKYADEISIFGDNDIHGICNVIIALGNELRDEYLVGVLLSGYRISNFTLNEIAKIHLFAKQHEPSLESMNLIVKLRAYADEGDKNDEFTLRVCRFVEWFDNLRHNLLISDISDVVDAIYKDTGIALYKEDVLDKFIMFKDWLCDNFIRFGSDISTIAQKLENMKLRLGSNTSVKLVSANDDKITCMTMHSSKGLEFPCVIVCDLESASSHSEGRLVFSDKYGFVLDDYNEDDISSNKSIERILRDEEETLSDISEEIRLLYVALTRPKERLTVVTNLKLDEPTSKSSKSKMTTIYKSIMRQGDISISRQHWILSKCGLSNEFLSALLRLVPSEELRERFAVTYNGGKSINMMRPISFNGFELLIDDESDLPNEQNDEYGFDDNDDTNEVDGGGQLREEDNCVYISPVEVRIGQVDVCCNGYDETGKPIIGGYKFEDESNIPFKVSVSQIKSTGIEETLSLPLKVNDFSYYRDKYTGIIGESAADVGTFVHKLLRFVDLRMINESHASYEEQVDELISDKVIREQDRELAIKYKDYICWFASSELGKRLSVADGSNKAEYEKPIVFATPVGDDFALVQGIIDCIFYEGDEAIIIDYKTDSMYKVADVPEARAKAAIEYHGKQVKCYEEAIKAAGIKVKESYIVLLKFGEAIKVE